MQLRVAEETVLRLEPWALHVPVYPDADYSFEQYSAARDAAIEIHIRQGTLWFIAFAGARVLLRHPRLRWPLADLNVPEDYGPHAVPPGLPDGAPAELENDAVFVGRATLPAGWRVTVASDEDWQPRQTGLVTPWIQNYAANGGLPRLVVQGCYVQFQPAPESHLWLGGRRVAIRA